MRVRRTLIVTLAGGLLAGGALAAPATAQTVAGTSTGAPLVISQVYGGGGNGSPTGLYAHDFVVLFNRSAAPVSIDGMSLQYTSASGTNALGSRVDTRTALSGTIAPGASFLVKGGNGSTPGLEPLPTPDVDPGTNAINLDQNAGRLALVTGTTGLGCNGANCTPAQLSRIVDLIGYGSTAAFFEGSAPAGGLTNLSAAHRKDNGCIDTDDNAADFVVGRPAPRNSTSPATPCVVASVAAEQPASEPVQQPAEQPASDPVEQPAEQPAEQPVQQPTTEPTLEQPITVTSQDPAPTAEPVRFPAVEPAPVSTCTVPILQPVNCDGSSVFRLGSTVPVKFDIPNDGRATFSAVRTSSRVLGTDDEYVPVTLSATNGVDYRYAGGAYHFNWSTKGLTQGTYVITITIQDGDVVRSHKAQLSLRG